MSVKRLIHDDHGSAAVEFSLVLPLFLVMVIGTFAVGWAAHSTHNLRFALAEGARALQLKPTLTQSAGATASVEKFARAINGKASFPRRLDLTALVGQVELAMSDDSYINVDVIFKLVGLDPAKALARAVRVDLSGSTTFLVMHPFDLLKSRLANLHELREKQNDKGAAQLRLAIAVARAYLQEQAARYPAAETGAGRSPIQTLVSEIEKLAIDDAGRKVAKRWGVHVADAIDPSLIPSGAFWTRKWPTLKVLMSTGYASGFAAPFPAPTATKNAARRHP